MNSKQSPKISVILPVYNVEAYIGRCIESLQAQTMSELEFIVVDDCSTDKSITAVEAWAAEDSRVRIIHNKDNVGEGPSRNVGIGAARGDYFSFIDPDDYMSKDFYELLYEAAISSGGHDIAKGFRCKVDETSKEIDFDGVRLNNWIRNQLAFGRPLYCSFHYEHQSALYRKSLFENANVKYGSSENSADTTFLLRCCYQTEDIVFEDSAVYYYTQREGSAIYREGSERAHNEIDALEEKLDFLLEQGVDDNARDYLLNQVLTRVSRFQECLGEGRAQRDAFGCIQQRLAAILELIPEIELSSVNPRIKDILSGSPLTTPDIRFPGEGDVRISIVLPICKPEKDINKCIASLRSQLLDGLEFIFVDDCSGANSMVALEAWATEDNRVRMLHNKESIGVARSLNRGIEMARGDYFFFANPDDYASRDFYEFAYASTLACDRRNITKSSHDSIELLPAVPTCNYAAACYRHSLKGAFDWIDYVQASPSVKKSFINGCARASAGAIQNLTATKGAVGFKEAYLQIMKRIQTLPFRQRIVLWLKVHRLLISRNNLSAALRKPTEKKKRIEND